MLSISEDNPDLKQPFSPHTGIDSLFYCALLRTGEDSLRSSAIQDFAPDVMLAEYQHQVAGFFNRVRAVGLLAAATRSNPQTVVGMLAIVIFGNMSDGPTLKSLEQRLTAAGLADWSARRVWMQLTKKLSNDIAIDMDLADEDHRTLIPILDGMVAYWRTISIEQTEAVPASPDALRLHFIEKWQRLCARECIAASTSAHSLEGLGDSLQRILLAAGIKSVEELRAVPRDRLRLIPGIGRERLKAIDAYLRLGCIVQVDRSGRP